MRKILSLILAGGLALPILALAQPGPPGDRGPGDHGRHAGPAWLDPGFVADVLDMTEDQIVSMRAILEDHHQAVEPLRATIGELHSNLADLLQSPEPDPTEVGSLTIEIHDLREEIGMLQDAAIEAITALLTPDQVDRWEVVKDVLRALARSHRGDPGGSGGEPPPV